MVVAGPIAPPPAHLDPEYRAILLRVGECLAAWSHVEHALQRLFVQIMAPDDANVPRVFSAVISFETRLAMVNALIERDTDAAFQESWNATYNKLSLLHRRRHQVAHFTMVWNATEARYVLAPFFTWGKTPILAKQLTSQNLRARVASFDRAERRVNRLYLYVLHRQGKLPENALQEGDPAGLLQMPTDQSHEEI